MYQLFAVLISFSIIPLLIKKKLRLSYTLLTVAAILALVSNIGFKSIWQAASGVFIDQAPRDTILTVAMVSVLGGLMGRYKILEKIVRVLEKIIKNRKNILMIIPAFMGLLVIPGGALLSAPFIDDLGRELKLSPERRAVINLVFRHIAMFIMPYSTGLLIVASSFPDLNILKIIALNLVFISLTTFAGYLLYIKDIEIEILSKREDTKKSLVQLLVLTSPIYIPVIANLAFGMPFFLALIFSVLVVYFLSDKKDFLSNLMGSISWHTVITVTSILIIKEIILRMDSLLVIFTGLFNASENIFFTLAIFLVTSIFFGFITGNQGAALAIILPMLSQLHVGENMLYIYIYFAYVSAFMGYFFSPLHL